MLDWSNLTQSIVSIRAGNGWDTSNHDWLEGRGEPVRYLVRMIDDATSRSVGSFVQHDGTRENMGVLWRYVERQGRMVDVYTDRAAMFMVTPRAQESVQQRQESDRLTQIGRGLRELGIGWIPARRLSVDGQPHHQRRRKEETEAVVAETGVRAYKLHQLSGDARGHDQRHLLRLRPRQDPGCRLQSRSDRGRKSCDGASGKDRSAGGQRAMACNGLRHRWQLWHSEQLRICNLHGHLDGAGFKSHLRHTRRINNLRETSVACRAMIPSLTCSAPRLWGLLTTQPATTLTNIAPGRLDQQNGKGTGLPALRRYEGLADLVPKHKMMIGRALVQFCTGGEFRISWI